MSSIRAAAVLTFVVLGIAISASAAKSDHDASIRHFSTSFVTYECHPALAAAVGTWASTTNIVAAGCSDDPMIGLEVVPPWNRPGVSAYAGLWVQAPGARILKCTIRVPAGSIEPGLLVHEVGHCLGLDHHGNCHDAPSVMGCPALALPSASDRAEVNARYALPAHRLGVAGISRD